MGGEIAMATRGQEAPAETEVEAILQLFYNNLHSIEQHAEAKTATSVLIEQYPNDPLLYELWCAIEWSAISLELEMKFDERRDILGIAPYRKRAEIYHEMVRRGLQSADQSLLIAMDLATRLKLLFAKGALHYADSKFAANFEEGFTGLIRADQAATLGIKEFKKALEIDPNFSAVYLYLGGTRYQISSQSFVRRTTVRFTSYTFAEINTLCQWDVVNKSESVRWLEKAYAFGAPEPWLKKNWIESGLVLHGMYEKSRVEASLKLADEITFIASKEFPLLVHLLEQMPENKKLREKHQALNIRLDLLKNYLRHK
jgi:tetratricopeptide (TPR) repeat protein